MKGEKNIMIIGGAGQVATGFLQYLNESAQAVKLLKHRKIIVTDLRDDVELVNSVLNKFSNLNLSYEIFDYKRDLSYFMYSNNIDTVVHLAPESSTIIFKECEKMEWTMYYMDASIYLSSYSGLKYPNHNLLSNFIKFDEIKGNYKNVLGASSLGCNPGNVNALVHMGIRKFGLEGLRAVYVIEKDRVYNRNEDPVDEFQISWSGSGAVQELVEEPVYFSGRTPCVIKKPSAKTFFKFNLDGEDVYGNSVVHEECYNFSKLPGFENIETTFLYSLRDDIVEKLHNIIDGKKTYDKYHVYSPSVDDLYGDDRLGVLLVYNDKEVVYYNTMEGDDIASGVTKQVSSGVFAGFMTLDHFKHKLNGVTWLDDYLQDEEFLNYYLDTLLPIFPIKEVVRNSSDGLLADRAVEPYEYKPLEKIITDNKKYLIKETYSFENTYWSYIEAMLEEEGENIRDINIYGIHFSDRFKDITNTDEEVFLELVYKDYFDWIKNYKQYNHNPVETEGHNIYSIPLSYIEEVLLDEGEEVNNINKFIFNDVKDLAWFSTENEDEYYEFIFRTYKKKEYV